MCKVSYKAVQNAGRKDYPYRNLNAELNQAELSVKMYADEVAKTIKVVQSLGPDRIVSEEIKALLVKFPAALKEYNEARKAYTVLVAELREVAKTLDEDKIFPLYEKHAELFLTCTSSLDDIVLPLLTELYEDGAVKE